MFQSVLQASTCAILQLKLQAIQRVTSVTKHHQQLFAVIWQHVPLT